MRIAKLLCVVLAVLLIAGVPAMAQEKKDAEAEAKTPPPPPPPNVAVLSGAGIGAGLAVAITILGAGWGFGRIGAAALESMARQPEIAARIQTAMLIIAALLEGATFFGLIVGILINGRVWF